MTSTKRPTLRCLATELGLSVSTVSRVLNGKGREFRIGKETEKRVLEAAKRLRLSPNLTARELRLQSSQTIGLVVPDIANPFFARIAASVAESARQHKYSLLLCDSHDQTEAEINEIQLLQDRSVEGLVICPVSQSSTHLASLRTPRCPSLSRVDISPS